MPRLLTVAASLAFGTLAAAQSLAGSLDNHPPIKTWKCSKKFGCKEQQSYIVLDAGSHWIHQKDDQTQGCGNWGSPPNATVCPDEETCAKNCVMHGISDYPASGVSTNGDSLTLDMLRPDLSVISPRVYLLNSRKDEYEMLHLLNGEFSFDVDMAKLPCGMNSALYLSEMSPTGAKGPLNPGGAAFGTGYCDAQCFTTPFLDGVVCIALGNNLQLPAYFR
jgi:cellulase